MQAIGLGIKTKKVVLRGVKYYKILSMNSYNRDELPEIYFNEYPYCYKDNCGLVIETNDKEIEFTRLEVGYCIPQHKFEKMVRIIQVCGEKLHNINEQIKVMKKEWNGEQEFEI